MKSISHQWWFIPILLLFFGISFGQMPGQTDLPDTSLVPPDSSRLKPWEIVADDTVEVESSPAMPRLVFYDSVRVYFLSRRFDIADQATQSFGRDAGDFLRPNPSNLCIDYQPLPMRKTVSPFALPGNRLDVIMNNRTLHPLEHLPEPDNMIGFDDIPTVPVQRIFNIEGPLGIILGGDNAVSSLIMVPHRPESYRAESRLVVDKGNLGYANTKAVFSERKKSGRLIQLAAEYRKTDGISLNWDDDTYHQWGNIYYPLNNNISLILSGRLYRRQGGLSIRPFIKALVIEQNRRDRDLSAGLEFRHSVDHKSGLEFRHQRSESAIGGIGGLLGRKLDIFDNAFHLTHEALFGGYFVRAEFTLTEEEYHESGLNRKRHRAQFNTSFLKGDSTDAVTGGLTLEKVGGYDPLPSGILAFVHDAGSFNMMASAGFIIKFPRQYELDLLPHIDRIIDPTTYDYFESGYGKLKPEKQLVGNLTIGAGRAGDDLTVSLTGGRIYDAIDWLYSTRDTLGLELNAYQTGNHQIEFANVSIRQRLSLNNRIFLTGGASYRYQNIDGIDDPPYSPDYQVFSGLELHQYVKFLDMHLYGFIEGTYIAPFKSYPAFGREAADLGDKIISNLKLSFRIKSFRFYYVWQNLFLTEYELRDDYIIRDRLTFYGLTWDFLD